MLTWSYYNEMANEDHLKVGEMSVYVDEKTGTFLFTKESYGWSGEMIDFIIADQNGKYIIGHTDEFGRKDVDIKISEQNMSLRKRISQIKDNFKKSCTLTGNTHVFGKNGYGWPEIEGKEYIISHQMTVDTSRMHLADQKYGFLPLFLFNTLDIDAKLPTSFQYGNILPPNKFPLEDIYYMGSKVSKMTLISVSPTEYYIDLNNYNLNKNR